MGQYLKCLSFVIGIGTELYSVKGNQIISFTVMCIVKLESVLSCVNKLLYYFNT